jgi:peptidoglycan/xylan/chitin deacetylase (PgdA/CDA1 family)
VLVYHGLALRTGEPDLELVAPHGAPLFEAQMSHLARLYRLVDAAELPHAVAQRRRGERFPAAVTFDDDLASHVSLALPILRRTGVHATFFLTGATLKGPFAFWWQRLQQTIDANPERLADLFAAVGAAPHTGAHGSALHDLGRLVEELEPAARVAFVEQLSEASGDPAEAGLPADGVSALVEAGMTIGFHTRGHDPLPSLDAGALSAAFEDGRAELEEVIGRRLTVVAYPHGRADDRVALAARRAGFETGYTGVAGPVRADDDPLLLRRLTPSYRSATHLALQIVRSLTGTSI